MGLELQEGSELRVGLDGSDASFVDTRCKGEFNNRIEEGGGGRGRGTGVTPLLIKKNGLYMCTTMTTTITTGVTSATSTTSTTSTNSAASATGAASTASTTSTTSTASA